jgi:site-specific recombinase XerD
MDKPPTPIETLLRERARFISATLAERTLVGYAYDWTPFKLWCAAHGRCSLPATEDTVSLYLTDMLFSRKMVTTVSRHASAIAHQHKAHGFPSPVSRQTRLLMANAKRLLVEPRRQMRALTANDLRIMVRKLGQQQSPISFRDRSIITLGFASALRRSNIAALTTSDLEFTDKGVVLQLRKEKQNREGIPRYIGVPFGSFEDTCPVRTLKAWLQIRAAIRGVRDGAVYIHTQPGFRGRALRPQSVWRIVKESMRLAGLNPSGYGAHSLRAGFVTAAYDGGAQDIKIAEQTGHHDLRVLRDYHRRLSLFQSHAGAVIGL